MSNDNWMSNFYDRYRADVTFKNSGKDGKEGFFTHCECCDRVLKTFQMESGLCGECFDLVFNASTDFNMKIDRWYIENELWRNPQGSIEEEIFSDDDENDSEW